ncbi:hypothetical protein EVAR_50511_1 [Eumeta japonica]|uniref:Uncharacterized protein n=1 Tax=Eumeta variegata TaxID=151549 RepID=A0A4C1X936_EUMVA|nr:hypothetical protein EVAR_50511_1 [Eumeta japonica]
METDASAEFHRAMNTFGDVAFDDSTSTVPDFDPSHALGSNPGLTLGFDPDLLLNFDPGLCSRFCSVFDSYIATVLVTVQICTKPEQSSV